MGKQDLRQACVIQGCPNLADLGQQLCTEHLAYWRPDWVACFSCGNCFHEWETKIKFGYALYKTPWEDSIRPISDFENADFITCPNCGCVYKVHQEKPKVK